MAILDESHVSQMLVVAKATHLEPIQHLAIITGLRQMGILDSK
jgi:hypothetical protein